MFLILGLNHSTDKMFQASTGNVKQKYLRVCFACVRKKEQERERERDNESIMAAHIHDIQANLVVSHSTFTISER